MGSRRIGTSGWNYKHWRGLFYPAELPVAKWFDYYAQRFDTVEINNTFYRQPAPEVFERWAMQAPPGFLYAVKGNRYLTHMLKLKNPSEPLERFYGGARRLGPHLGPVLFQLPPNWKKNLPRLRGLCAALPGDIQHVIEFRHPDWLAEDTYELLHDYQVSLCLHDALAAHPRVVPGPILYVRFHGARHSGGLYHDEELQAWADWLTENAVGREVFVYFNNDLFGHAITNAQKMMHAMSVPSGS